MGAEFQSSIGSSGSGGRAGIKHGSKHIVSMSYTPGSTVMYLMCLKSINMRRSLDIEGKVGKCSTFDASVCCDRRKR